MSNFPEKMARGLRKEEWLTEVPPYKSAFFFDNTVRADGKREMSVVDLSFEGALLHLRKQRFGESLLFPAGFAILTGECVQRMVDRYKYPLSYEHHPTRNNNAHGNILLDTMKHFDERKIAARLAMESELHSIDEEGYLPVPQDCDYN